MDVSTSTSSIDLGGRSKALWIHRHWISASDRFSLCTALYDVARSLIHQYVTPNTCGSPCVDCNPRALVNALLRVYDVFAVNTSSWLGVLEARDDRR